MIKEIINTRDQFGEFKNREELSKIKGMSPKIYEQAIGFLRILGGTNPLDQTAIHPESYQKAEQLLKYLGFSLNDIGSKDLQDALSRIKIDDVARELSIDSYTLEDIISILKQPNRDIRDQYPQPILRNDILHIEDLKIGDKLQGTVRNVVDFGLFIDIGLKNDGLAHISKLSKEYLADPAEKFSVGDIVDCYVEKIDKDNKRVSLSLLAAS